jgi:hypothetical protein
LREQVPTFVEHTFPPTTDEEKKNYAINRGVYAAVGLLGFLMVVLAIAWKLAGKFIFRCCKKVLCCCCRYTSSHQHTNKTPTGPASQMLSLCV